MAAKLAAVYLVGDLYYSTRLRHTALSHYEYQSYYY